MVEHNLAHPERPDRSQSFGRPDPFGQAKAAQVEDDPERDLWAGSYSGKAMFGAWSAGVLITLAVLAALFLIPEVRQNAMAWLAGLGFILLMWLYLIGVMIYRKLAVHYDVTTQRIKHRDGIFMRRMDRIELIDIDDVNYRQGLIQMLFGVGDITVRSSDTSHPNLVLRGIGNVKHVADVIDDARRKERRSRSLHLEQV